MKAVVLTGGVGGAKFVLGLERSGLADTVTAIVNTGDDFRHLGLHVSPDIDTLLYALSGKSNVAQGWGREGETWSFLSAVQELGGPDWFRLGDGDLALHVLRSERLARGETLSAIVADFAAAWGIPTRILPMSEDPVRTFVDTDEGELEFQRYFVGRQCAPKVSAIRFEGAQAARAAPGVVDAILSADAVFIAPSNPYLSVDPLLAVADIAAALEQTRAPIVAISPIVGGTAVKGPTAKIMAELDIAPDNDAIADHYAAFVDALLVDASDAAPAAIPARATHTLMKTLDDKIHVAREAMALAKSLIP
ncbi:2-phospho-L-lactate transferase [Sphingobium sufflavum]|uniref:2-phospho-L-lactate transferase n=1 Tax=Sphingobium sufflavum TaxID=1129547 RepID=UPI001F46C94D|nr:2-phospho-L-lactate transferase [Sphingobium sufflavum]MCE7795455.1 2-phospho-L-lactate transferase [Sphingobium sufflavum]